MMEHVIVFGAVVTVLTAIGSILYRITIGDGTSRKLDKLKAAIDEKAAAKKAQGK